MINVLEGERDNITKMIVEKGTANVGLSADINRRSSQCPNGSNDHREEDCPYAKYRFCIADGYAHTIGHRERDRPDIMAWSYSCVDNSFLNRDMINARLKDTISFLESIVANWKEMKAGDVFTTEHGERYIVIDLSPIMIEEMKAVAFLAGKYYGDEDYALRVLVPLRDNTPMFIAPLSNTVH